MIEKTIERLIFGSRWLMAPFYIGLIAVLAMLMIKFAQELLHFIPHVFSLKETDVILMTLSLLDTHARGQPRADDDLRGLRELRIADRHGR
jgi:uncharacterized protein (TIGR00645 family)